MAGMPQGNDKASQVVLKRFITIIESMSEKELDTTNVKMLSEPSRVVRLARGSGRHPAEVLNLIEVRTVHTAC
jgi:signal recognition particle subunit SRP54